MDLLKRRERQSEDRARPAGRPPLGPNWSDRPEPLPDADGPGPASPGATATDAPAYDGRRDPADLDTAPGPAVTTAPTPVVDRDRDGVDDRDERHAHDRPAHDRHDQDGVDDRAEHGRHEVVEEVVITRWSIADLVVTLLGAALALAGAVGLVRAGLDETWYSPVVGVVGADHTPLQAAAELGAGVLVALAGIARRRVLATLFGLALAVAAAVAAIETPQVSRELAIEDWWAWTLCAGGIAVVLMALVPRKGRIRRVTES